MADRDFQIRITTLADTGGAERETAALKQVEIQAEKTAAATKAAAAAIPTTGFPTPGQVSPPPGVVAPVSGAAVEEAEREAAIQSQLQVIAGTRLELEQARIAGNEALVNQLRSELTIRTSILGVMRAETLSQAQLAVLTQEEAAMLGTVATGAAAVATETTAAAGAGLAMGASLGKARGEAVVLARELATGGNYIRTMGSLLGALGIPISIAATLGFVLFEYFKKQAEQIKQAALEQVKLNAELEKELHTLGEIKDVAGYDKFRETARERLDTLRQQREIETDPKKLATINAEIAARESELARAPQIAAKALERAQHEEQIKFEMQEQVHELELLDSAAERARAQAAKHVETESAINKIRLEGTLAGIDERRDTGEISAIDAVVEKAKAKRDVLEENFNRQQENDRKAIESIKNQVALADVAAAAEEGRLQALKKRQQADVAAGGDVDKKLADFNRLKGLTQQADDDATQAEATRDEINRRDESTSKDRADAEEGAITARKKANDALRTEQNAADALGKARAAGKAALDDEKKVQDELIKQEGLRRQSQLDLNKARQTGEGIPAAEDALKLAQTKLDAAKKAVDEEEAREKAKTEKRQAAILADLHAEDEIQKAKDSGDAQRATRLGIELNYHREILALIREGLTLQQATSEAGTRRAEALRGSQFQDFKAGGSTVAGTIAAERERKQKEDLQREVFERERADLRDRIARGAKPSDEELKAFGPPEAQPPPEPEKKIETPDERNTRLAQERESEFNKAFPKPSVEPPSVEAPVSGAPPAPEKPSAPAAPLPPVDLTPAAEKLLTSGGKLDTAGDKLAAAADKLGGTKPAAPAAEKPAAAAPAAPPTAPALAPVEAGVSPAPSGTPPIGVTSKTTAETAVPPPAAPAPAPAVPTVSAEPIPYVQPPTVSAEPAPAEAPSTKPPEPAQAPPTKPPAPVASDSGTGVPPVSSAPTEAPPKIASSEEDSGIPNDPFRKFFGGGQPTPTPTPSPPPQAPALAVEAPVSGATSGPTPGAPPVKVELEPTSATPAVAQTTSDPNVDQIKSKTANIDVALSTRTKPGDQQHVIVDKTPAAAPAPGVSGTGVPPVSPESSQPGTAVPPTPPPTPQETEAARRVAQDKAFHEKQAQLAQQDEQNRRSLGAYGESGVEKAGAGRERVESERESAFDKAFHPDWQKPPPQQQPQQQQQPATAKEGGGDLAGTLAKLTSVLSRFEARLAG
jgi:hypothetical protein